MSHTSGLNFSPFRITRFSRQFVPDRASCSLSAEKTEQLQNTCASHTHGCAACQNLKAVHEVKTEEKILPTPR